MKLSQNLNDALNQQILKEYENSNKYITIASYFEDLQLKNLAEYFYKASQQEKEHGDKFVKYVNSRTNGKVLLDDIEYSEIQLTDLNSIGHFVVETEESTTESIEELYDLAFSEKSYIDLPFFLDMLQEQVEEEDWANAFAVKLQNVKDVVLFDATFEV